MIEFDYIKNDVGENSRFRIRLDTHITTQIVWDKDKQIRSLDELNADRLPMAELFFEKSKNFFKSNRNKDYDVATGEMKEQFIQDIAKYIDLRIPYYYYFKMNKSARGYVGIECTDGLKYQFIENMENQIAVMDKKAGLGVQYKAKPISENQKEVLVLIQKNKNLSLKKPIDELNMYEANVIIQYATRKVARDKETLDECLIAS